MYYISLVYTTSRTRKAIAFLVLFLFLSNSLFSQGENNIICFGDSNRIDFATNPYQIYKSSTQQLCGSSTISDASGNLLFYTNGIDVWDATHNRMPNGFGLYGDTLSNQTSLIVKKPTSANIYYIFTTSHIGRYGSPLYKGLNYSILDMSLNGGRGDIVSGMKNINLKNLCTEKIAATFHINQRDIWVISRDIRQNRFTSYLLTPLGIIDSIFSNSDRDYGLMLEVGQGTISISPNSKFIACCSNSRALDLYKFNNSNGIITFIYKDTIEYGASSSIFSNNSNILYLSEYYNLLQYDISILDSLSIFNSKINLVTKGNLLHSGIDFYRYNNKIYFSQAYYNFLGVINEPDSIGIKCNFNKDEIRLPSFGKFGLQNIYYFQLPSIYAINTCLDDTTRFHISDTSWMSKIVWDFGDGTGDTSFYPKHVYSDTGTYHVTATYYYYTCDSVRVQSSTVHIKDKPSITLFNDGFKCASDYNFIRVSGVFDSILWDDGTNDTLKHIDNIGRYSVKAYNICGIDSTNIYIPAPTGFAVNLTSSDLVIGKGEVVKLNANVTSSLPIINYDWNPLNLVTCSNSTCSIVSSSPIETTLYSVTAMNSDSCTSTDTITVIVRQDKAVFIPSAFTPNSDGKNETFDVQILGATNISVSIWDRWGEKVYENPFQQNGAGQGWDGLYKGKQMQTDTYTYQMEVTYFDGTKKVLSGTVLLMK
jgi:gliding motility-associated-like protein